MRSLGTTYKDGDYMEVFECDNCGVRTVSKEHDCKKDEKIWQDYLESQKEQMEAKADLERKYGEHDGR